MPEISVIVPVYNVESYIEKCMDSICSQSLKDIEILCIDDCGTDNSMKIVEAYAKKDERIKILRHPHNKGLGAARNTGVRHSTGKYLACVDSDDWIAPTMLEKCRNVLEARQLDSVWVKVNTYIEDTGLFTTDNYYKTLYAAPGGIIRLTPENLLDYPVNAWNKVYRSSFIKQNNILWSDGLLYEDIEFYYQFYTLSHETYLIDELLYFYRWRRGSIMNQTDSGRMKVEDIYTVTYNIYCYLKAGSLLETYKIPFLNLLERNINLYLHNPAYTARVKKAAACLLKKINYPMAFKPVETRPLLNSLTDYHRTIFTNLAIFLINVIPVAALRRKIRYNFKSKRSL